MKDYNFTTLSETVDALTSDGYTEDFKAEEKYIKALYSKKEFQASELTIKATFRFEGDTNPEDETELFVLLANDGTKGTLVMSYSAVHNQNVELIKAIKTEKWPS